MNNESIANIWELACEEMKKTLTQVSFDAWLKDLKPVDIEDGKTFILSLDSSWKIEVVENHYINHIRAALKEIMSFDIDVKIYLEDETGNIKQKSNSFDDAYTFENFIVGSSNRFAHAASMAVADNPTIVYNPLVIFGPSGVGKTHLMLAIKNRIEEKFPNKKILYTRCEEFTNQLISSLRDGQLGLGTIDDFRARYRNVDVLLVDDIQFIAGKASSQEEFFNTFNTLYQNGKQIVVTLDRTPKDIKTLDDRIRSRFEAGINADITPPDFETKVGILKNKSEQLGITMHENIVYFIAEHIKDNTRQLEGVVNKIQLMMQIEQKTPTLAAVQNIIREVVSDTKSEPIRIERIITEVARTYNLSESDILSRRKTADLVKARQVAMYIAREVTDLPYDAIGQIFGRNHTTVLYTEKKIREEMKENPRAKEDIEDIIKNIQSEI